MWCEALAIGRTPPCCCALYRSWRSRIIKNPRLLQDIPIFKRRGLYTWYMVPAVPLFLLKNQPLRTVDVAMNCFPMITGDSVSTYSSNFGTAAQGPVYKVSVTVSHQTTALCRSVNSAFSPSAHLFMGLYVD